MCDAKFAAVNDMRRHVARMHSVDGVRWRKKEEQRIANLLTREGIAFQREVTVNFACCADNSDKQSARIDFVIYAPTCVIALEVDEDQHATYDVTCDVSRMMKIVEMQALGVDASTHGETSIVFVRYNPNAYKIDGQIQRIGKAEREKRLIGVLRKLLLDTKQVPVQILYMFYDLRENQLCILGDAEYDVSVKPMVKDSLSM